MADQTVFVIELCRDKIWRKVVIPAFGPGLKKSIELSPCGRYLMTVFDSGDVCLHELIHGIHAPPHPVDLHNVHSVFFSQTKRLMAVIFLDGVIKIFAPCTQC